VARQRKASRSLSWPPQTQSWPEEDRAVVGRKKCSMLIAMCAWDCCGARTLDPCSGCALPLARSADDARPRMPLRGCSALLRILLFPSSPLCEGASALQPLLASAWIHCPQWHGGWVADGDQVHRQKDGCPFRQSHQSRATQALSTPSFQLVACGLWINRIALCLESKVPVVGRARALRQFSIINSDVD
jgi:hypothetical protein